MKLLWTGTDVLMLNNRRKRKLFKRPYWILLRLLVKFLDRTMIEGHATNSELLKKELKEFGFKKRIEIILTPLKHTDTYLKINHHSFNILYYNPSKSDPKFWRWLYGIDLVEKLKIDFPNIIFLEANGSLNLEKIYPFIDMYVRPNRHDGNSRIVRECKIQGIPYYWSNQNPDYEQMKKMVQDEFKKSGKMESIF